MFKKIVQNIRRRLGQVRRAVQGVWLNHAERPPTSSKFLQPVQIGESVEGRPIESYRLGSGTKSILITGGLHGNEIGGIKVVQYALHWLHSRQKDFENLTLWVIPILNPDGHARAQKQPDYWKGGRIGRLNANGIDPNRNFPTGNFKTHSEWTHGENYKDRTEVYCGEFGGSEPEVRTLIDLIQNEKIDTVFMYHTAGGDVTGSETPTAQALARQYAEVARYRLFTLDEWQGLDHTGSSKDWADENQLNMLEIECRTRWGADWKGQKPALHAVLKTLNDDDNPR